MPDSDRLILQVWAKNAMEKSEASIKSLVDCGMDSETAIDLVFDNSVLALPLKMQVLERVGNYRHQHQPVTDCITGKLWCATCQTFLE